MHATEFKRLISETLRDVLEKKPAVLTADKAREIVREALAQHSSQQH
jgi:hypothetical protein